MTSKNRKIWNFQILSDRPDRPIPAIWIGRIVGKSILGSFPSPGTHTFCPPSCGYIFVDCRPFFHLFERSKIHILAQNFCDGRNFCQNFLRKKNLYASSQSPVNISWIGSKLMKIFKNAIVGFLFRPHCTHLQIFLHRSCLSIRKFPRVSKIHSVC